jgi:hypothetical protein
MGACTMGFRKLVPFMILGMCQVGTAQSPTYGIGRAPTRMKCAPGISRSVRLERNSRPGTGPPRKARRSIHRRGAQGATGDQDPEARRRH